MEAEYKQEDIPGTYYSTCTVQYDVNEENDIQQSINEDSKRKECIQQRSDNGYRC